MSTLGVEGDLSCTDNNSAHDADYLDICDHHAKRRSSGGKLRAL
jgi:hypothetical protein